MQQWQFWIDRGGTFTDIVARRPDGSLATHKLLSDNPEQYADAALAGIRRLLGIAVNAPIPCERIEAIKMGTTVATNALLERKGEPTVLAITRGFRDALRIAYQNRPRLFDLHIVLPELLYSEVIELDGRIGAHGELVQPLNEEAARAALRQAYERGFRALAIVCMHGYRYSGHEQRVAAIAREIGYSQISASHEVSPLMKLVPRGDTTVADAYLSPILQRYISRLRNELPHVRLQFMQSNGGLADARAFRGKDSVLSGPAGGIVGMARTRRLAGCDKVIGYDMGGAPTLHFDGPPHRGGPDSAGADPGPACYRRGGPLTITDCNVLLGRVQPEYFPAIFGPQGDQPLDHGAVARQFAQLAQRIAEASGQPVSAEQAAAGFIRIAVGNMANAIKKISVQRGHDVTRYALVTFGGAGGQHACQVADARGMKTIFVHPLAGVLSAYGMGLADQVVMREASMEMPLHAEAHAKLAAELARLSQQAIEEAGGQGIAPERISVVRRVHLRYEGTDSALIVLFDAVKSMTAQFEAAYRKRFSFLMPGKALVVEAVSVEAIGASDAPPEDRPFAARSRADARKPPKGVAMFADGRRQDVPLYLRSDTCPGDVIDGPAIIAEANATTVVEPGWRAEITALNHLVLTRVAALPRRVAIGAEVDPVMLEIFNNLFMSIAEQMGVTLQQTAYSVNIKERLDFSCALFDANGNLIAYAPHMPVHLCSMGEGGGAGGRAGAGKMRAGDVYMLNDPYHGGTHLPDVTVVTPVFDEARTDILFYVASRGHHADIGGSTPGSMPPDSKDIEEEGVLIDNFKLVEGEEAGEDAGEEAGEERSDDAGGSIMEGEARALLASCRYPASE